MLRGQSFIQALGISLLVLPGLIGCGGTVTERAADDDTGGSSSVSGGSGGLDASGGQPTTGGRWSGGSGGVGATGGTYIDPGCPDEEPPPPIVECDPLEPYKDCPSGFGCYPYVSHPYGSGCGFQQFGALCDYAGSGVAGDFCGDEYGNCAPGYLCVVGAGAGKRCQKLCPLVGDSGCPAGLLCGETDIEGYGVCF